jgi:hypothetical protein
LSEISGAGRSAGTLMSTQPIRLPSPVVSASRWVSWLGLALIVLGCLAGIATQKGDTWDFANFYDAGHKALIGQTVDLYDEHVMIGGAPAQGEMGFLCTPITSYLYAPLAMLQPLTAMMVFKIENTMALWLSLFLIWRQTRPAAGPLRDDQAIYAALFVGAAVLYQPLWTIYRVGGQTTPTILLLLTLGWIAHIRGRLPLSALCFVAAVAIKPFLFPALAFLVLFSSKRFLIWTAIIGAAAALISVAIMGWPIHEVFIHKLLSDAGSIFSPKYNAGLFTALDPILLPQAVQEDQPRPHDLSTVIQVLRLAVVAVFVWLAIDARRKGLTGAGLRSFQFLLAIIFTLMITPVAWPHYLMLMFPFLAALGASWRQLGRSTQILAALIVAICVEHNIILMLWLDNNVGLETRPSQIAISLANSLPLMLTLALLVWRRGDIQKSFVGTPATDGAVPALAAA